MIIDSVLGGDENDDDRKNIFEDTDDFNLLIKIVTLPDDGGRAAKIRRLLGSKFAGLDYTDVDILFLVVVGFGSQHHLGRFNAGAATAQS